VPKRTPKHSRAAEAITPREVAALREFAKGPLRGPLRFESTPKGKKLEEKLRQASTRAAQLSVLVSPQLFELIEYIADLRGESVDIAVNHMLEEIVEIERIRHLSDEESRVEQKLLGASMHSPTRKRARRRLLAMRTAALAKWRRRRSGRC
jgi:hypothetical protein